MNTEEIKEKLAKEIVLLIKIEQMNDKEGCIIFIALILMFIGICVFTSCSTPKETIKCHEDGSVEVIKTKKLTK